MVTFEDCPSPSLQADGIEADTLGLFVGESWEDTSSTPSPLPPQIILYLANLWDYAHEDDAEFRREVRRTYLHELGHFLGLDEEDLDLRDLD
jgi:predicted Zn-dependent protease with MMP-like domain